MKRNLSELTDLWLKEPSLKQAAKDVLKHLRRALKELLEHLGFSTLALKPTEHYEVLQNLELEQFFQALRSRLIVGETLELQANSGLTADFWINGMPTLYAEAVASKNPETTKNPSAALSRFACFLVQRPEWNFLCPSDIPLIRQPSHGKSLPRVYPKRENKRYGLPQEEWPQRARDEAEKLKKIWSTGGEAAWEDLQKERQIAGEPLGTRPEIPQAKLKTIEELLGKVNLYFGWQVNELKVPKEDLTLQSLKNSILVRKFNRWQRKRSRSHASVLNLLRVGITFAKMENFAKTKRRKWQDIPEILDLQDFQAEFAEQYAREKQKSTEEKKLIRDVSHPQIEQMQEHSLQRCAPFTQRTGSKTGKPKLRKRSKSAILQDHLIRTLCSFVNFVPVRQQQIRTATEEESLLRRLDNEDRLAYRTHLISLKVLK